MSFKRFKIKDEKISGLDEITPLDNTVDSGDVAIVGIAARLLDDLTLEELWPHIASGNVMSSDIPERRLKDLERFLRAIGSPTPTFAKMSYLEDIATFDHEFFNISPREAMLLEPQQRIVLENIWHVIENAGYGGKAIIGSNTGVYLGIERARLSYRDVLSFSGVTGDEGLPGNVAPVIASRISHILDLKGPTMLVDTACSSSLVALHLACTALFAGDCDQAIVGGISVMMMPPSLGALPAIMTSSGVTKSFDDSSDGTSGGEGVISIFIKRASEALKSKDHIYAIIKGTAINSDGHAIGITAPNADAQADVIEHAWKRANVLPETIGYLEAHGTGTKIGDPVEIEGLKKAFERYTTRKQFCCLSTVKANIGHLGGAAGLAGIVNGVLALTHRTLPPLANFNRPNRLLGLADSPFYINLESTPWAEEEFPRRCGVSSFGMSGTNAHVVLQEAPRETRAVPVSDEAPVLLFVLSAKSQKSLEDLARKYLNHLRMSTKLDLEDICFTCGCGRFHHPVRLAIIAKKTEELVQKLWGALQDGLSETDDVRIGQHTIIPPDRKPTKSHEITAEGVRQLNKEAEHLVKQDLSIIKNIKEIGELYLRGAEIPFRCFFPGNGQRRIPLPGYTFHRIRSWPEAPVGSEQVTPAFSPAASYLGRREIGSEDVKLTGRPDGPYTKTERLVASSWSMVLGYHELDIDASYFELGGDSLFAAKIITLINKKMDLELKVTDLLAKVTIRDLAEHIDSISKGEKSGPGRGIPQAPPQEEYDVSFAEHRYYVLWHLARNSTAYNIPFATTIEGALDVEKVKRAFLKLVERHDSLRTSYHLSRDQVVKRIHATADLEFEVFADNNANSIEFARAHVGPFDLSRAPLARISLNRREENCHDMVVDMHHIISDGVSHEILFEEFIQLYHGQILPEPKVRYVDFSYWQRRNYQNGVYVESERFWLNSLKSPLPKLEFPTDRPRPGKRTFVGDVVEFPLPKQLVAAVEDLSATKSATLFMFLYATYFGLLSRYTGQEDIIVGTISTGREHDAITRTVGAFANFLPVRMQAGREIRFTDLLELTRQTLLGVFDHQNYPFDRLVDKIEKQHSPNRNPVYDTMIVLQNQQNKNEIQTGIGDLRFRPISSRQKFSTLDFKLDVFPGKKGGLECGLEYSTELFNRSTMEVFAQDFRALLGQIIADSDRRLCDFALLGPRESSKTSPTETFRNDQIPSNVKPEDLVSSSCSICASFTATPLDPFLKYWLKKVGVDYEIFHAPYHQVFQELIGPQSEFHQKGSVGIILFRLDDYIRDLKGAMKEKENAILETGEQFEKVIRSLEITRPTFLFFLPGENTSDLGPQQEIAEATYTRIYATAHSRDGLYAFDLRNLPREFSMNSPFDPYSDRQAHVPFNGAMFSALAFSIARRLSCLHRPAFKVIALDCDNTLWSGVVGEDGARGIQFDQGNIALQEFVLAKKQQGFLLVLCSKNNEQDVWEVFDSRSEMLLKRDDLVGWRINWDLKSKNLIDLAQDLNLGLSSFIFIDDSPLEISKMMHHCPDVYSIRLPSNPGAVFSFLKRCWAFDKLEVSEEDSRRTTMYKQEKERKNLFESHISLESFLAELKLEVTVEDARPSEHKRLSQLSQRTNQFNTTTLRMSESEIENYATRKDQGVWSISARDKFGTYGIIGALYFRSHPKELIVESFMISCRALGRGVEQALLACLKAHCERNGIAKIAFRYVRSNKNAPAGRFLREANLWDLDGDLEEIEIGAELLVELKVEIIDAAKSAHIHLRFKEGGHGSESVKTPASTSTSTSTSIHGRTSQSFRAVSGADNWEYPLTNNTSLRHLPLYKMSFIHGADELLESFQKEEKASIEDKSGAIVLPGNELEAQLLEIWRQLLDKREIGVTDDFFASGGDSIKAVAFVSMVREAFGHEIELADFFAAPTIAQVKHLVAMAPLSESGSIPRSGPREGYPVSSAQQRLFMLQQMEPGNTSYNLPFAFSIKGPFDKNLLQKAIEKVIRRHEILRTGFEILNGKPVMRIYDDIEFAIDYSEMTRAEVSSLLEGFVAPFDLTCPPLFRVKLFEINDNEYVLAFDIHHIITDGQSIDLLLNEILACYGGHTSIAEPFQYRDFACWQQVRVASGELAKEEEYWAKNLDDDLPTLTLPTDFPRPPIQSYAGNVIDFFIDGENKEALLKLSYENKCTLFMTLLACFNLTLSAFTRQKDIVVGTTISGRNRPELRSALGLFIETLPIRVRFDQCHGFKDLLALVKEVTLSAFEHQDYPYKDMVAKYADAQNLSRNPLFDVMLILQNFERAKISFNEITASPFVMGKHHVSKLDITLEAIEMKNGISFQIEYCTALFTAETMRKMAETFCCIVDQVCENSEVILNDLYVQNPEKVLEDIASFNNTELEVDLRTNIAKRFSEAVGRWPQNIACTFEKQTLNYEQLDKASDQLARRLSEKGVAAGSLVALRIPRSVSIPIAVLAVLKLEAAYLPIDVKLPSKRVDFMISDAKPSCFVSLNSEGEFDIELTGMEWDVPNKDRLAYVVYTSGTTGQPKGVLVSEDNLISYVEAFNHEFELQPTDTAMMQASFSFDWFVEEFFPTIVSGANFAIVPDEITRDPALLSAFIQGQGVTIVSGPPVLLGELSKRELGATPRVFITGGDTVIAEQISRLVERNAVVYNTYGPTEATVCATYHRIEDPSDPIPIGRPISNVRCHVLDDQLRPLPENIPGELCIAGHGVTAGYLNRPEATRGQFISLPFEKELVYRTGDLAKWLPDGKLVFLGRIDEQVSIRGYRVEPKEIEATICSIDEIASAVVVPKPNRNRCERLVAYFIASRPFETEELRERLIFELPEYMIPALFVQLEELPLTVHQKVDLKALPEPSLHISKREIVAPSSPAEIALADILSSVLGVQPISMVDNFFSIGGDSLKAMTVVSRIERELGRRLAIVDFFQSPTIGNLAKILENAKAVDFHAIPKTPSAESYPLSNAQRRLYVLNSLKGVGTAYNISVFFEVIGSLDKVKLGKAFKALIDRHEILRTSFSTVLDEPRQFISETRKSFAIDEIVLQGREVDRALADFVRPFNIEISPLLRVGIVELEPAHHILAADIHHIVADGVSLVQLIKEAAAMYSGVRLEPLRIQYADYAVWEGEEQAKAHRELALDYWKNKFSNGVPILNLPYDRLRPASFDFKGNSHSFTIETDLLRKVKDFCANRNKTLFSTLMAAYGIALSKLSGQQDLIIGTPTAGRVHADLEQLVGMFATTLPLRLQPVSDLTFEQFVDQVNDELLSSTQYQQVGIETIVELTVQERDTSRNSLFDVMFVLQNNEASRGTFPATASVDLEIKPYFTKHRSAKFDLTCEIYDFGERLHGILEFATSLFNQDTIARYATYFEEVLKSGVTAPNISIKNISMQPEHERQQVLVEFNRLSPSFDGDKLLPQRFEEQVEKTPERVAVSFGDETITYRELGARSNQLAHYLRNSLGVRPGHIVGISIERSFEMIVAILGVMKSGAGYLAVDPSYPRDRVAHILADSAVEHLLIDRMKADLYGDFHGSFFSITEDWSNVETCSTDNPEAVNNPDDVLYVIYTSGTTGMPNGAMLSHDILNNLITWMVDHTSIDTDSRCLQFTSINFCVSFQEIIGTLVSGGEVCLIDEIKRQDINYLMGFISKQRIANLYLPFSYMNFLFNESSQWSEFKHELKNIITAGEQLKITKSIRDFLKSNPEVELHNHYGSSEMHVVTSYTLGAETVEEYPVPPAGIPISNTQIFILDENLQPTPIGVFGELFVASRRELLGYINAKELNEQKLIDAPHILPNHRLYRSGDIGRWLPDGNIELKGRKDTQIKLRGFRIELSEIETKLLAIEGVKDCVVEIKNNGKQERVLAAYLVLKGTTQERVRGQLGHYLPHYMIPQLVALEALPLMPNGKVDREALPEPTILEREERVEPRDSTEWELADIWAELLDQETTSISIDDNFFYIGGHSLRATKMLSMIAERLDATISLNDIFNAADLRSLAQIIRNAKRAMIHPLRKVSPRPHYHLPISQRSLLKENFVEELDGLNNIVICVELIGELELSRLQSALNNVVDRHVSLRMSFELTNGEVLARVADRANCEIQLRQASEESLSLLVAKNNTRFALDTAPLFRAVMTQLGKERHGLILIFDHIIFDGVSGRIFVDELLTFYDGKQLEPVENDYIDYAEWQNELLETDLLGDQEAYWKSVFARPISQILILSDYPSSRLKTRRGTRESLVIQGLVAKNLRELAQHHECTLYIVLLAALNVFASRLTGLDDVAVSSPLAARRLHPSFERMIGMFASTLTVRSEIDKNSSFDTFLSNVRTRTLEAFSNQDFPLELLYERHGIHGTSPLFFAFQNFEQSFRIGSRLTARRLPIEVPFKTGGLGIDAYERGEDIEISILYAAEIFKESTIRGLLADFKVLLELLAREPGLSLGELLSPLNAKFSSRKSRDAYKLTVSLEQTPYLDCEKLLKTELYRDGRFKMKIQSANQIQEALFSVNWNTREKSVSLERHDAESYHRTLLGHQLEIMESATHYFHHDMVRHITVKPKDNEYEMEIEDSNGGTRSVNLKHDMVIPIEMIEFIVVAVEKADVERSKIMIIENGRILPSLLERIDKNSEHSRYLLQTLVGVQIYKREYDVARYGFITKCAREHQNISYQREERKPFRTPQQFEREGFFLDRSTELKNRFRSSDHGVQESIIVLHDDRVVFEHAVNAPLTAMRPIHSLTKSITSLIVGIAIDQGAIEDVDVPYWKLVGERVTSEKNPRIEKLTLRHVMSMQAGFEKDASDAIVFNNAEDPIRVMLDIPMDCEPGLKFVYNNNLIATLAPVLERATGEPVDRFAARYLFEPLGIDDVLWTYHRKGFPMLNGGLCMKPLDVLRIGKLILDGGRWQDTQIVSLDWIEESTKPHSEFPYDPEYILTKYGLLWWRAPRDDLSPDDYLIVGRGWGGQLLVVDRKSRVVVVTSADNRDFRASRELAALDFIRNSRLLA